MTVKNIALALVLAMTASAGYAADKAAVAAEETQAENTETESEEKATQEN